jgi:hypothetical protein
MHQTHHINSFLSTLCEACSWSSFSSQILIPQLSQAMTSPPAAVRTPAYTEPAMPPPPYAPPSSINGILTPGMVPDSVPREIRYEVIGGKMQAIEHFKAEDIGIKRGYNNHHGWDDWATSSRVLGHNETPIEITSRNANSGEAEKDHGDVPVTISSSPENLEESKEKPASVKETAALEKQEEPSAATTVELALNEN